MPPFFGVRCFMCVWEGDGARRRGEGWNRERHRANSHTFDVYQVLHPQKLQCSRHSGRRSARRSWLRHADVAEAAAAVEAAARLAATVTAADATPTAQHARIAALEAELADALQQQLRA